MQRALFQSIGDGSRSALVERRLAEAITTGMLRAGERLPSESELAAAFGVAPTTVREALGSLRARDLVVTVRGRHGGSYVHESADPVAFAREALAGTTLVALRDMGVHHATIAAGCMRLAARRATGDEVRRLAERLERVGDGDLSQWRQSVDDLLTEAAALGQSPRLTRDLMQRQVELSPFLRLLDVDPEARSEQRDGLAAMLAAIAAGDERGAVEACEAFVRHTIGRLVRVRAAIAKADTTATTATTEADTTTTTTEADATTTATTANAPAPTTPATDATPGPVY